ncbi:hypothetical protein ACHAXS_001116 [Conticribra weissflogii]
MKTFMTVALLLASASAQTLYDPKASSLVINQSEISIEDQEVCYNDRPRPVRNGERNRFNLQRLDAYCADSDGITYEYGDMNRINNADDCAEFCVNGVTSETLYRALRGFENDCGARTCRCLYDEGTITNDNSQDFRSGNWENRSRKGRGSIARLSNVRGTTYACYKRVGSEMVSDVLQSM